MSVIVCRILYFLALLWVIVVPSVKGIGFVNFIERHQEALKKYDTLRKRSFREEVLKNNTEGVALYAMKLQNFEEKMELLSRVNDKEALFLNEQGLILFYRAQQTTMEE